MIIGPGCLEGECPSPAPLRSEINRALLVAVGLQPWSFRGEPVGWATPRLLPFFESQLDLDESGLAALEQRLRQAASVVGLTGWRDERQRLIGASGQVIFGDDGRPVALERSLFRPLGLLAQSVQLNARASDGRYWVARRSLQKAIDPGLWDSCVAGGLPSNETPDQSIQREAREEAGIHGFAPESLRLWGMVRVARMVEDLLHIERVWVYEWNAPSDWRPRPEDDEVMAVDCWSLADVRAAWSEGRFNHEAAAGLLAPVSSIDGARHSSQPA